MVIHAAPFLLFGMENNINMHVLSLQTWMFHALHKVIVFTWCLFIFFSPDLLDINSPFIWSNHCSPCMQKGGYSFRVYSLDDASSYIFYWIISRTWRKRYFEYMVSSVLWLWAWQEDMPCSWKGCHDVMTSSWHKGPDGIFLVSSFSVFFYFMCLATPKEFFLLQCTRSNSHLYFTSSSIIHRSRNLIFTNEHQERWQHPIEAH